ncbi:hypothetical protein [Microbacterium gorillae]|uniref:hypothetical protein n=1 Tax=Microbacterium gorillae TaxID=1231063 RepID=UPI003D964BC0
MSMIAGIVLDRMAAYVIASSSSEGPDFMRHALREYGKEWAESDIDNLLREARRLADDFHCRCGVDRRNPEWARIDSRISLASSNAASLRVYGVTHAEADIALLTADIEQLEEDLMMLQPRL